MAKPSTILLAEIETAFDEKLGAHEYGYVDGKEDFMATVEKLLSDQTPEQILHSIEPEKGMYFFLELDGDKPKIQDGGIFKMDTIEIISGFSVMMSALEINTQIGVLTSMLAIAMEKKDKLDKANENFIKKGNLS